MRILLSILTASGITYATAANADTQENAVKQDLARQAALAYAIVLGDAVKAGRIYSREAAVSGVKRHAEEFIARQYLAPQDVVSAK